MMGDNRNDSWDARYWSNTYVTKDKILGKATFLLTGLLHILENWNKKRKSDMVTLLAKIFNQRLRR